MKKSRSMKNKASIFGVHAVQAAWENDKRTIHAAFVTTKTQSLLKPRPDRPEPQVLPPGDFESLCGGQKAHQNVALEADPLPELTSMDLIIRSRSATRSLIIMLDQVTDPHNLGAIIRSAAAFECDGIILQRRHAPPLEGIVAKTACGGLEHVPVAEEVNLARTIEALKEERFFAYGLDEEGEQDLAGLPHDGHTLLVLGAEGSGLRRLVKEKCDSLIRLPTSGKIKSLNVSNAVAISLYALRFSG